MRTKHETTRRSFLQQSAGAAAVVAATTGVGVHAQASKKGATVRLGLIGCGGIMRHHVRGLVGRRENAKVVWLCDVDPQQIEKVAAILASGSSTKPRRTKRFEDVFEDDGVDACVIATPHHWHAPLALRAMRAGKDVYLEKPISHVFDEGPLVTAAAKKYGRVVQQGSQMRSSPVTMKAGKLLRDGVIGEVKVARAWTAEKRTALKPVLDGSPPAGVDYDRWLGPAPKRPFNAHRFHKTWRLFHDYANGEIGDDGIHDLDMATWALDVDTLPSQITSRGGRMFLGERVSEYPDNMNVVYEYPDGRLIVYENYPFTAYGLYGFDNGNAFYGTEGYMVFSRRGAFNVYLGPKGKPGPTEGKEIRGERGYAEHMGNFLQAVRDRTRVNAPPEVAHRSCALVHLGNITHQVEGRLDFDPRSGRFVESERANDLLSKQYRPPYGLDG